MNNKDELRVETPQTRGTKEKKNMSNDVEGAKGTREHGREEEASGRGRERWGEKDVRAGP